MTKWLGTLGSILAFVISPGFIIFPAIYWYVEGHFPTLYFILLGVGIVCMIISGLLINDE